MSAISTTRLAFVKPDDVILHSQPLYGSTATLLNKIVLPPGVAAFSFGDGLNEKKV